MTNRQILIVINGPLHQLEQLRALIADRLGGRAARFGYGIHAQVGSAIGIEVVVTNQNTYLAARVSDLSDHHYATANAEVIRLLLLQPPVVGLLVMEVEHLAWYLKRIGKPTELQPASLLILTVDDRGGILEIEVLAQNGEIIARETKATVEAKPADDARPKEPAVAPKGKLLPLHRCPVPPSEGSNSTDGQSDVAADSPVASMTATDGE